MASGESDLSDRQRGIRHHFERVASRFGDTVHPYAARRRGEALSEHARGRILEVGCGSGAVTAYLIRKGEVVAGDVAPGMAAATRENTGVTCATFDGGVLPFGYETFDSVVCAEAIYYLPRPFALIEEAYRVLRSGGALAISCMGSIWQRVDRWRIRAARLGLRWGSEVPLISSELRPGAIVNEMERVGFHVRAIHPMILIPFDGFDRLNRRMEMTPIKHLAMFRVIHGEK